ncbi:hypothetical protein AGMMS50249_4160 [candidate division SR1 bacterium]|nr:hypothetical protein AGMMS50249_4160 [candidate division SR1 bacterium]
MKMNSHEYSNTSFNTQSPFIRQIEGSFGDKKIQMEIFPVRGNNKVLINIHGTFGTLHGGGDKYKNLAQKIQQSGIGNAVLFETSRNSFTTGESFEQKKQDFLCKTFQQELEDCKLVIKDLFSNSTEYFGVDSDLLQITLNGNSLGGILALFLAQQFSQIKNISTVGTGFLTNNDPNTPILDDYPDEAELKKVINEFKGNILLQYGTEDSIFTESNFLKLSQELKNAEIGTIKFINVDHTFTQLDQSISTAPYEQIQRDISDLMDGKLVSGEIVLQNQTIQNNSSTNLNGLSGFEPTGSSDYLIYDDSPTHAKTNIFQALTHIDIPYLRKFNPDINTLLLDMIKKKQKSDNKPLIDILNSYFIWDTESIQFVRGDLDIREFLISQGIYPSRSDDSAKLFKVIKS